MESATSGSSKPIKFAHLTKLANQSMLIGAHYVIKIAKICTVALMKVRIPWFFDVERNVSIGKKKRMVQIYFLKLLLTDFG